MAEKFVENNNNITTVITDEITKVVFNQSLGFMHVRNDSEGTIRVSAVNAELTENADGVVSVSAGGTITLAASKIIFVNGNCTVINSKSNVNPFKVSAKGGGTDDTFSDHVIALTKAEYEALTEKAPNKYYAIIDDTDEGAIQTLIDEKIGVQNDKINVLDSRMDTFTHLTEGSTTGDAELADIRVGYDGTVYDNAGNAVRGQISQVSESVTDIYLSKVKAIGTKTIGETTQAYNSETVTRGYYLNGAAGTPRENANYCYTDYIYVKDMDYYYESTSDNNAVYFYDENKQRVGEYIDRALGDYKTASSRPDNSVYCRFNMNVAYINLCKFYTRKTETVGYYIGADQVLDDVIISVGTTREIKTLKDAIDFIETKDASLKKYIVLDEGEYNALDGFNLSSQANTFMGIVLPNNTYIVGNGDPTNVVIYVDGTTLPSNLVRNEVSVLNFCTNNGLKNVTIHSRNVRYGVHNDDSYRVADPVSDAVQTFENVIFVNKAQTTGDVASYNIGIGAKKGQHFIFKNCEFRNEDTTICNFLAHNGTTAEKPVVYEFEHCRFANNGAYSMRFTVITKNVNDIVNIKGCKANKEIRLDKVSSYASDVSAFHFNGYGNSGISVVGSGITVDGTVNGMLL